MKPRLLTRKDVGLRRNFSLANTDSASIAALNSSSRGRSAAVPSAAVLNYVTESTYDTVMWQKVQAKALFIEQMRRNEVLDTAIEDLSGGDIGSAAAETEAVASGDPGYLSQVHLEDDVKRLTALERAHQESERRRDWRVPPTSALPAKHQALDRLNPIAEQAANHAGATHTDRSTAANALATACRRAFIAEKTAAHPNSSP